MAVGYYVIVYESENPFVYNKLVTVLYANDWVEVNKYLLENLDRFRQGVFDCFWYRLGKKVGVELVYDEEENVTADCYDEIVKKVTKELDLVGIINCMDPKKSEFVLETMIVAETDVLFNILKEFGYLRVMNLEKDIVANEVPVRAEKSWWKWF